ncbi:MAG: FAD-dependent oxidoreductase [Brumimicrobium sp.]
MLTYSKLSFWEKDLFFNSLDIVIVGAGIVGYSTAISLKEKFPQKKIVIVERGYLPTGASTKNAGFTCFGSPTELLEDLQSLPEEAVIDLVRRRYQGLQILLDRCGKKQIDYIPCGSHEVFTDSKKDANNFQNVTRKINYLNELIEQATTIKNNFNISYNKFGFNNISKLISSKGEGQIDTGKMMDRLHRIAVDMGVHILFSTEVESWEHTDSNQIRIKTNYGDFETKKLIIATNGLSKKILPSIELEPARAQVIITKPLDKKPFEGTFHYDAGYYYFRNVKNRILLGGGRNVNFNREKTTQIENTEEILNALKDLLHNVILPNQTVEIEHQWAGIMGIGKTRNPVVKELSPNIFAGIRLGGMGVALGSLVGKELSELIQFD